MQSFMNSSSRIGLQNVDGQASLWPRKSGNVRTVTDRALAGRGRTEDAMHIPSGLCRGCLLALTLTAAFSAPARAQVDTGTISGTVKDTSGGVLPGASVIITHEGQGFTLTTVTREDGTYIFTPIRTGAYSVDVEFP